MDNILVHPRINCRHPEISDADVVVAMKSTFAYKQRPSGEWIALGFDKRGRLLELVYNYDSSEGMFFVFHGMTPPSAKTFRELKVER